MNQSPNTVLSYEPMEVSALNNEFWDGFMSLSRLAKMNI
jgi:hypothetical protein